MPLSRRIVNYPAHAGLRISWTLRIYFLRPSYQWPLSCWAVKRTFSAVSNWKCQSDMRKLNFHWRAFWNSRETGQGNNTKRAGPNGNFMRRRNTSFSRNISNMSGVLRYLLHLQRRLSKIIEVKVLKLSSSSYFADYVQLKSSFKQQIFAKI